MTDAALLKRFISMGDDCEFGTMQARCGADCLDLLRWAGTGLHTVIRLLDDGFAAIADPACLSVRVNETENEYWVENSRYGFRWHTWVKSDEMPPERVLRRERTRLAWQANRLVDDLVDGRRILLRKALNEGEHKRLDEFVWHVRAYGPAHILFVLRDAARAGAVERVSPTLLLGYLPPHPEMADQADVVAAQVASWLPLCRQAAMLADLRSGIVP